MGGSHKHLQGVDRLGARPTFRPDAFPFPAYYVSLDNLSMRAYKRAVSDPHIYSTTEAAAAVGITRATLQDWIKKGKFKAPKLRTLGKIGVRLWTDADITRLKLAKSKFYQEHKKKLSK